MTSILRKIKRSADMIRLKRANKTLKATLAEIYASDCYLKCKEEFENK